MDMKQLRVKFKSFYKVKQGRKWVEKVSEFTEDHKSEADVRIRALALNLTIVEILYWSEQLNQFVSIPQ